MTLNGFGKPPWADVAAGRRDGQDARSQGPGRNDQQQSAWARRTEFKRKMEMEKARITRGKKEKNYLLFINKDGDFSYDEEVIADLLEKVGINFDSVLSMNKDPERRAATEILLKPDVQVKMEDVNRIVLDTNVRFDVEHIGYRIEVMHIRKLGLTADPNAMAEQIKDVILPFVEKVVDVTPTTWKISEENKNSKSYKAFNGRYDGNYRVRVIPRENIVVPGFIPVGPEKVRGEVVYQIAKERNLLCSNCFKKDHLRGDRSCTGGEGWAAYVESFGRTSDEILTASGIPVPKTDLEKLQEALQVKDRELEDAKSHSEVVSEENAAQVGEIRHLEEEKSNLKEEMKKAEEKLLEKEKERELLEKRVADSENEKKMWMEEKTRMEEKCQKMTADLEASKQKIQETEERMDMEGKETRSEVPEQSQEDTIEDTQTYSGIIEEPEGTEDKAGPGLSLDKEEDVLDVEKDKETDMDEDTGVENTKKRKKVRGRCGECEACIKEDCGECVECKDMIKFGGTGKRKRPCLKRPCLKKKKKMDTGEAEKNKPEEDLNLQLSQSQDSAAPTDEQANSESISLLGNEVVVDHLQDAQYMLDGDTDNEGSPLSGFRGPGSTRSFEADSLGGASRRESFSGGGDEDEEEIKFEEEVHDKLDWHEDVEISDAHEEKVTSPKATISPIKKLSGFWNSFVSPQSKNNDKETGKDLQNVRLVKNRIGDWESKSHKEEKQKPNVDERDKRIIESKLARENSLKETKNEFVRRMSESGDGNNIQDLTT